VLIGRPINSLAVSTVIGNHGSRCRSRDGGLPPWLSRHRRTLQETVPISRYDECLTPNTLTWEILRAVVKSEIALTSVGASVFPVNGQFTHWFRISSASPVYAKCNHKDGNSVTVARNRKQRTATTMPTPYATRGISGALLMREQRNSKAIQTIGIAKSHKAIR
jgi:hypothetical protein